MPTLKVRCTTEKLAILKKHSKTFFFNHIIKNIVNYHLQKFYLKKNEGKGFKLHVCDIVSQCAAISVALTCKSNYCEIQEQCDCKWITK